LVFFQLREEGDESCRKPGFSMAVGTAPDSCH
jgi:hypothetical protein